MYSVFYDESFGLNPRRQRGFAVAEGVLYEDALKVGVVITSVFRVLKDPFLQKLCETFNLDQRLTPTLLELGCLLTFKVSHDIVAVDTIVPPWIDESHVGELHDRVSKGLHVGFQAYKKNESNFDSLGEFTVETILTPVGDYSLSDMFIEGRLKVQELYKLCPKSSGRC